jgi:hypothetical protein
VRTNADSFITLPFYVERRPIVSKNSISVIARRSRTRAGNPVSVCIIVAARVAGVSVGVRIIIRPAAQTKIEARAVIPIISPTIESTTVAVIASAHKPASAHEAAACKPASAAYKSTAAT